jgi:hypothetical protein
MKKSRRKPTFDRCNYLIALGLFVIWEVAISYEIPLYGPVLPGWLKAIAVPVDIAGVMSTFVVAMILTHLLVLKRWTNWKARLAASMSVGVLLYALSIEANYGLQLVVPPARGAYLFGDATILGVQAAGFAILAAIYAWMGWRRHS